MTQLLSAREGKLTPEAIAAARGEGADPESLAAALATGRAVLPANRRRDSRKNRAIGQGLRVKVNANLGTSADRCDVHHELQKLRVAEECGVAAMSVVALSDFEDVLS